LVGKKGAYQYPNIGGTFDSVKKAHDHDKHPISFRFSARAKLHKLARAIEVAGNDPGIGVFFVPVDDPSKAVKMTRIAENSPSQVTGIAPNTGYQQNRIEIRTQYSGTTNVYLKAPRTITSAFVIEEA
jgi:hypothetical protein